MFCYNVQQIASHKPGSILWQVSPPVKALGHRMGAERGKEYSKKIAAKGNQTGALHVYELQTAGKATKWKNKL